jgi:ABC-type transport system substrate-binding protein
MKLFAILGFAALLALPACNRREDDGNLLVFHGYQEDDMKTWDPANAYDVISLDIAPHVYETLYQYAYLSETYKVQPLLAADLPKYSADRLTLTIPLKHGVKFQDDPCFKETNGKGRELKAQDFIYAWKRLALPSLESQGWWIFDGKIAGVNAFHDKLVKTAKADLPKAFADPIEGFKALDDYTIQIKLTKPYPQLQYVLAMTFTAPIAHEQVAAYADENGNLIEHPVGTGPFVMKEWARGRRVVLERNPNFHPDFYPTEGTVEYRKKGMLADAGKPVPFLDRIVWDVVKEAQPRWLNFMKGNLDIIIIPKDNFNQAIGNDGQLTPELAAKGVHLNVDTGVAFYYISFNMKDKLIGANKFLRQAMSAAIDRDKWIEIFTNGTGKKMVNCLPPGIADRPGNSRIKYDYNLAQAKELLKKAGYPEGKGLPVINFDLRGADSVNRQYGEFFAQQWAAIGIRLNPIYNTFPAYLEKAKQGNLQVSYGGWSMDYPDAENVYQLLYGPNMSPGPGEANYDNPALNKLYEQIAVSESGPARSELIRAAEDIVQEDVPWAMGYYYSEYTVSQPWVLNYRGSEIISNKYKFYRINRDVKKRYLEAAH